MNLLKILPLSRRMLDVMFEIYANDNAYLRGIAKTLRINPSLTARLLNKMYDAKILSKSKKGVEIIYSLNKSRDYGILVSLLEEYHLEKAGEKYSLLKTMISLLINNHDIYESSRYVCIFGSYAAGNASKDSDIDMLFVNDNAQMISKACREMSSVIGKKINPLAYSKKKYEKELAKKEPFLSSIINNVKNRLIIKDNT